MSFANFPASPEALFLMHDKVHANTEILEARRTAIADEIYRLSQVIPPPLGKMKELQIELGDLNDELRRLSRDADMLVNVAVRGLISSSDVKNASNALKCANDKAALALNNLAQFANFLALSVAYVDFVAAVAKAAATAPASLLLVADAIDKFQKALTTELERTLTKEELEKIRGQLAVNCVQAS